MKTINIYTGLSVVESDNVVKHPLLRMKDVKEILDSGKDYTYTGNCGDVIATCFYYGLKMGYIINVFIDDKKIEGVSNYSNELFDQLNVTFDYLDEIVDW